MSYIKPDIYNAFFGGVDRLKPEVIVNLRWRTLERSWTLDPTLHLSPESQPTHSTSPFFRPPSFDDCASGCVRWDSWRAARVGGATISALNLNPTTSVVNATGEFGNLPIAKCISPGRCAVQEHRQTSPPSHCNHLTTICTFKMHMINVHACLYCL